MDNLNKHQIILLALLVAFVVSIATGITVVSLMDQSPQPVTQTINRVIEKTIEKVTPTSNNSNGDGVKEKTTVVVKEEDLTISAIDKNVKSFVHIFGPIAGIDTFLGDGVIVSDKGYVVAEKTAIAQTNSYVAELSDGTKVPLEIVKNDDVLGITLLQAKPSQDQKVSFTSVNFGDSAGVKLGQSIISLSGSTKNTVNIGNIVSIDTKDNKNNSITTSSDIINSLPGGILFNLSGEVVGFHTSPEKTIFIASNILKEAFSALMPK
ncbi:MAG: serine protease [bacterium]